MTSNIRQAIATVLGITQPAFMPRTPRLMETESRRLPHSSEREKARHLRYGERHHWPAANGYTKPAPVIVEAVPTTAEPEHASRVRKPLTAEQRAHKQTADRARRARAKATQEPAS